MVFFPVDHCENLGIITNSVIEFQCDDVHRQIQATHCQVIALGPSGRTSNAHIEDLGA